MFKFTYGLPLRPAGPGAVPAGDHSLSSEPVAGFDRATRHGTVSYGAALTDNQINQFDLVPFLNDEQIDAFVISLAEGLGRYKHRLVELASDPNGQEFLNSRVSDLIRKRFHYGVAVDFPMLVSRVCDEVRSMEVEA